jgi:hypothetical protein
MLTLSNAFGNFERQLLDLAPLWFSAFANRTAWHPLPCTKLIFPLQPLLLSDKVKVKVEVYYLKVNHEKDIYAGISA